MSATLSMGSARPEIGELESLRGSWLCLVAMGVTLIILGFAAIGSSFVATLATMLVFGILLIVGSIAQVVTAIWGANGAGFSSTSWPASFISLPACS